jgi:hypothetical protein
LSIGGDGSDVGLRQERCRGKSHISGEFVVEVSIFCYHIIHHHHPL